jgi:hypothetical protein
MTPEERNNRSAGRCLPIGNSDLKAHLWWWETFYPNSPMIENIKANIALLERIAAK